MPGRCLLDTNVVIALLADEAAVRDNLAAVDEALVPCLVIGELLYGARKSARSAENLARIEQFAAACALLPCDLETARRYGEIKHALRRKGRPLPENDIWVAAVALQHGLTLVTRDRHFREVDGLDVAVW
jgi:tRNA(fMet)-specific endonuclease VapC